MKNCWSLKLSKVALALLLWLVIIPNAYCQFSLNDSLSRAGGSDTGGYLFPINPGKPAMLTGTMGELRSTHFHAGLDINTPAVGIPVACVADGYVIQANASTSGYGNVLYVRHHDGNTSVYAHLNEFKDPLGRYVREQRYQQKTSEISLTFSPNQFPVKRGDIIALSGNTGSSGGPHLHFEVRDQNNEAINPLTYNFTEVKDNVAPWVQKIAIRTLDSNARVNDQFGRYEFSLVRQQDNYTIPSAVLAHGSLGIEVLAHDKMQGSRFRYGINKIEMLVDSQRVFSQNIDKVNFGVSRGILTLMDFKTLEQKGARFNKLYVDDGNTLGYNDPGNSKSTVYVADKKVNILIRLTDYHGNTSTVKFKLVPSPPTATTPLLPALANPYEIDLNENILKVSVRQCHATPNVITALESGQRKEIPAAYGNQVQQVFLVDLKTTLPDSIETCQGLIRLHYKDRVPSGTEYRYYSERVEVGFGARALYDTAFLQVAYDSLSQTFTVGSRYIPLHHAVEIAVRPTQTLQPVKGLGLYRKEGNSYSFVASNWQNGWVRFASRTFGDFTFRVDTLPPTITKLSVTNTSARFRIRDQLSGIASFEANINGEWLLMVYDYKTGIVHSERLDTKKLLKGELIFRVIDNAGNEAVFKQTIL